MNVMTADTKRFLIERGKEKGEFPVYLLTPTGEVIEEKAYMGDGVFGGRDMFVLLARWNKERDARKIERAYPREEEQNMHLHKIGQDLLYRHPNHIVYPLKIVENKHSAYEDMPPSILSMSG